MIYLGTAVIGRDQFSVRRSTRRRSAGGFTIRSTTFYPAEHVSTSRVVDHGFDIRTIRGSEFQLRHIELSTESGSIHLWYDPEGRLMLVDRPEDRWRAERGS